ncbi:hypothetical protein SAMN05192534_1235 [Alteribacillus persepolensis]|uniref:Uncharacterized protein n=1 Tax=Alteribacillus persepolensis TaxID=568899 RepID=A0A1G8I5T1_9BACI|nr:hypothetical protein SAMN05192534_1235 [Alteribacillus persepolensis]
MNRPSEEAMLFLFRMFRRKSLPIRAKMKREEENATRAKR